MIVEITETTEEEDEILKGDNNAKLFLKRGKRN